MLVIIEIRVAPVRSFVLSSQGLGRVRFGRLGPLVNREAVPTYIGGTGSEKPV